MGLNRNNKKILIIVTVLIIIGLISNRLGSTVQAPTIDESQISTTLTHSNGILSFDIPDDFGLALNKDQILVNGYIPACDDVFDYCIYYNDIKYKDTNFNSAGLRIQNRLDLKTINTCLNTSPNNYTGLKSKIVASTTDYIVSSFAGIGDAGAGHYASGELYRLAYDGTCHEFETRVGLTQFANYPAGSIKEFTLADQNELKAKMLDIIKNIVLSSGEKLAF